MGVIYTATQSIGLYVYSKLNNTYPGYKSVALGYSHEYK